jgi:hypothetical protein
VARALFDHFEARSNSCRWARLDSNQGA